MRKRISYTMLKKLLSMSTIETIFVDWFVGDLSFGEFIEQKRDLKKSYPNVDFSIIQKKVEYNICKHHVMEKYTQKGNSVYELDQGIICVPRGKDNVKKRYARDSFILLKTAIKKEGIEINRFFKKLKKIEAALSDWFVDKSVRVIPYEKDHIEFDCSGDSNKEYSMSYVLEDMNLIGDKKRCRHGFFSKRIFDESQMDIFIRYVDKQRNFKESVKILCHKLGKSIILENGGHENTVFPHTIKMVTKDISVVYIFNTLFRNRDLKDHYEEDKVFSKITSLTPKKITDLSSNIKVKIINFFKDKDKLFLELKNGKILISFEQRGGGSQFKNHYQIVLFRANQENFDTNLLSSFTGDDFFLKQDKCYLRIILSNEIIDKDKVKAQKLMRSENVDFVSNLNHFHCIELNKEFKWLCLAEKQLKIKITSFYDLTELPIAFAHSSLDRITEMLKGTELHRDLIPAATKYIQVKSCPNLKTVFDNTLDLLKRVLDIHFVLGPKSLSTLGQETLPNIVDLRITLYQISREIASIEEDSWNHTLLKPRAEKLIELMKEKTNSFYKEGILDTDDKDSFLNKINGMETIFHSKVDGYDSADHSGFYGKPMIRNTINFLELIVYRYCHTNLSDQTVKEFTARFPDGSECTGCTEGFAGKLQVQIPLLICGDNSIEQKIQSRKSELVKEFCEIVRPGNHENSMEIPVIMAELNDMFGLGAPPIPGTSGWGNNQIPDAKKFIFMNLSPSTIYLDFYSSFLNQLEMCESEESMPNTILEKLNVHRSLIETKYYDPDECGYNWITIYYDLPYLVVEMLKEKGYLELGLRVSNTHYDENFQIEKFRNR